MSEFIWPVRVYYEDTDHGGVVYHANYLRFMERARTEWLRAVGVEQDRLMDEHNVVFAVHSLSMEFRRPARFNELLDVSSVVETTGRASLTFHQTIVRPSDRETLCDARVKVACIDGRNFKPRPIPQNIMSEIVRER